jgi:PAS domain S-box-containing protein
VRHQVIALRVLALVALGLLVVQTIRRLRRGIACVTEFANAAAAGELQQPLPDGAASRPREFNQILEQIGLMRNALRDNLRAVQQSAARSKAILRTMRDGVVQVDSAGIIINVNDALSETFGYEEDELIGKPFRILMPDAADAAGPASQPDHPIPVDMYRRVEMLGKRKSGEVFPSRSSSTRWSTTRAACSSASCGTSSSSAASRASSPTPSPGPRWPPRPSQRFWPT